MELPRASSCGIHDRLVAVLVAIEPDIWGSWTIAVVRRCGYRSTFTGFLHSGALRRTPQSCSGSVGVRGSSPLSSTQNHWPRATRKIIIFRVVAIGAKPGSRSRLKPRQLRSLTLTYWGTS